VGKRFLWFLELFQQAVLGTYETILLELLSVLLKLLVG